MLHVQQSILISHDCQELKRLLLHPQTYQLIYPIFYPFIVYINEYHPDTNKIKLNDEKSSIDNNDVIATDYDSKVAADDADDDGDDADEAKSEDQVSIAASSTESINTDIVEPLTAMDDMIRQFQRDIRDAIENCIKLKYSKDFQQVRIPVIENKTTEEKASKMKYSFHQLYQLLEKLDDNLVLPLAIKSEIESIVFKYIEYSSVVDENVIADNANVSSQSNLDEKELDMYDVMNIKLIEDEPPPVSLIESIFELVTNCNKNDDLDKKEFESTIVKLYQNFAKKITLYAECLQSLNDEICILSAIFDENDRIRGLYVLYVTPMFCFIQFFSVFSVFDFLDLKYLCKDIDTLANFGCFFYFVVL